MNNEISNRNLRNRSNRPQQNVLRLTDLVHAIRKHIFLIGVCAGIGLVIGIVLSAISYMRGEMSKQYAITASIAVTSQNQNGLFTSQSNNPVKTDVDLAQEMVDAVCYVIKSDATLNSAADKLSLIGVSSRDIYNNLYLNQYNKTQIIEMTLYWRSAQEGIEILETIIDVAPRILIRSLKLGNVSVVNEPKSKYLIGGNLNASLWVLMAFVGLSLGAGFAILELLLRPTLLNTDDMETQFSVEVLGEIPENKAYFHKKRSLLIADADDDSNADVLDNYSSLAHIIKNRIRNLEHPCVYITSAAQNEGKTAVTAHLAVQLAELDLKTLVIDFDTRNPKLGGLFINKVEYENSINALYRGETTKEEAITHLSGYLDILPAVLERRALPYGRELFDLIRDLEKDYDVILMDTAPVGQVADTMGLNQLADVALMVVRFDSASMDVIRDSLLRLDKSGMNLLGCIVNGVKEIGRSKHRGYHYGYGANNHRKKPYRMPEKTDQQKEWEEWEKIHLETEQSDSDSQNRE